MSGRDIAKGLVMAAIEARRRANQLRANGQAVRLDDIERFVCASMFDELADWCDMEAAIRYDDGAEPDPAPPRVLPFPERTTS